MQAVLVPFQNNAVDELTPSDDLMLEISITSNSTKNLKWHEMALWNFVILWHVTLVFFVTVDDLKLLEGVLHENDLLLDHVRQTTLTGAGIVISISIPLEISEKPAISRDSELTDTKNVSRNFPDGMRWRQP